MAGSSWAKKPGTFSKRMDDSGGADGDGAAADMGSTRTAGAKNRKASSDSMAASSGSVHHAARRARASIALSKIWELWSKCGDALAGEDGCSR